MDENGKCLVCRVKGQGSKDFVCETCLERTKNGPLFACHGCNQHGPLTDEAREKLQNYTRVNLNLSGIIVVTPFCNNCIRKQKKQPIIPGFEIYSVRRHFRIE